MRKWALWIAAAGVSCGLTGLGAIESPLSADPAPQASPEKVVCGFESAEDWTTENESPRELSAEHVTEGKHSLKVTFLTKPEWPTVITTKVPADWGRYA